MERMLDATYVVSTVDAQQVITDSGSDKVELYESLEDANKTISALKASLPFLNFEAIKVTRVDYCGECHDDFEAKSIVHYAWLENNCFCAKCKAKLNIKDWELRYFIGK